MSIAAAVLIVLAGILTVGVAANVASLHSSDAAGNGMADAFAWFQAVANWGILAILLLICSARGGFPGFSGVAMLIAFLFGMVAQVFALQILTASKVHGAAATLLPAVLLMAPVLILVRAAWGIFPPFRTAVPELAGSWAPIGILILVCLIPFPFRSSYTTERTAARAVAATARQESQAQKKAQDEQRIQETLAKIAAFPSDSNLFSAIEYCADPEPAIREAARAKARMFSKRQSDAEGFLAQSHDATLRELPNFDLKATPAVCASAKKMLAGKAAVKPFDNDPIRIEDAEREIGQYVDSMRWLLANACDCKAEIAGMEEAVRRFANSPRREKLLTDLAAAKSGNR